MTRRHQKLRDQQRRRQRQLKTQMRDDAELLLDWSASLDEKPQTLGEFISGRRRNGHNRRRR